MPLKIFILIAPLAGMLFLLASCGESTEQQARMLHAEPVVLIEYQASDCQESGIVFLVDPAVAQAALPEGWVADDASAFLGLPVPSGRGAIVFTTLTCAQSSLGRGPIASAELLVVVEPPELGEMAPAGPAAANFYDLVLYHQDALLQDLLEEHGFVAELAGLALDIATLPLEAGATSQGRVEDAEGVVGSYSTSAAAPLELSGSFRLWQSVNDGLVLKQHTFTAAAFSGAALSCSFREGSPPAQAVQASDCLAPNDALALTSNGLYQDEVRLSHYRRPVTR